MVTMNNLIELSAEFEVVISHKSLTSNDSSTLAYENSSRVRHFLTEDEHYEDTERSYINHSAENSVFVKHVSQNDNIDG